MRKYIDIRVEFDDVAELKELLALLRKIQWCGEVGATREIPVVVDGDGSARLNFHIYENNFPYGSITNLRDVVILKPESIKSVENGENFSPHYIGE